MMMMIIVDVDNDVNLEEKFLTKIPLKFGNVSGDFFCFGNRLTSLEGCPKSVVGNFSCSYNELTSLIYCPEIIGGALSCRHNKIISFEYLENIHIGYSSSRFLCSYNPIYKIWKLFEDFTKIDLFNDYDIIRGNSIILDRLNSFLQDIGIEKVEKVEGYINI